MAQTSFSFDQIALTGLLVLNIIFCLLLFFCRMMICNYAGQGVTRCRGFFSQMLSIPARIGEMSNFGVTGAVMRINCDLPPPYEQAIKYPSLVSIPTRVGHCNPVSMSVETLNSSANGFHQDLSSYPSSVRSVSKGCPSQQSSSAGFAKSSSKPFTQSPGYIDLV